MTDVYSKTDETLKSLGYPVREQGSYAATEILPETFAHTRWSTKRTVATQTPAREPNIKRPSVSLFETASDRTASGSNAASGDDTGRVP